MAVGRSKSIPVQFWVDKALKDKLNDLVRQKQNRVYRLASVSSVIRDLIEQAHEKTFMTSDLLT